MLWNEIKPIKRSCYFTLYCLFWDLDWSFCSKKKKEKIHNKRKKYTLILMMMTTIIRSSIISITLHQQQGNEACFFTSGDDEWLRGRLNSNRGSLQVPASWSSFVWDQGSIIPNNFVISLQLVFSVQNVKLSSVRGVWAISHFGTSTHRLLYSCYRCTQRGVVSFIAQSYNHLVCAHHRTVKDCQCQIVRL